MNPFSIDPTKVIDPMQYNKNAVISPSENSLLSLCNLILSLLLSDSIPFSMDKLSPIIVSMIKLTNKIKN